MKRMLLAAFACVTASCAFAESGTFTNTSATVNTWAVFGSAAQWTNESGVAVSALPFRNDTSSTFLTVADTATLADVPNGQLLTIPENGQNNFFFGALVAPSANRIIDFGSRSKIYAFADTADFKGLFRPTYRYAGLEMNSTASFTPVIHTVGSDVGVRFANNGAQNAGCMRVDEVFGLSLIGINARGSYEGKTAGTVEIAKTGPHLSAGVFSCNGAAKGGLAFCGQSAAPAAAIPGDPWMHLDAAVAVTTDGNGGVTSWNDVRGAGYPFADAVTVKVASNLPDKPTVKTVGALPFVDFGAHQGRVSPNCGGSNNDPTAGEIALYGKPAALKWSETRTDIRHVFYVFQETQPSNTIPWTLGVNTSGANSFIRGGYSSLFDSTSAIALRAGRVAVDGVRVPYDWADDWNYRPHLVSVGGAGNLTAGAFALHGGSCAGSLRSLGGVRIGEILVYTNALTETEVAQLERHLLEKWIPAAYHAKSDLDGLFHVARNGSMSAKTSLTVNGAGEMRVRDVRFDATLQTSVVKDGPGTFVAEQMTPKNLPVTVKGGALKFRRLTDAIDDSAPAAEPYLWLDASKKTSMVYETVDFGGGVSSNYVSRWNDVRPAQTRWYATAVSASKRPAVVDNAQNGLSVMDFRDQTVGSSAYCGFNVVGQQRMHNGSSGSIVYPCLEAFVVYHRSTTAYVLPLHVSDIRLRGSVDSTWYERSQSGDNALGASWRLAGKPLNFLDQEMNCANALAGGFTVISAAAARNREDNCFEAAGIGGWSVSSKGYVGGGMRIAEILCYKRRLTAAERRNTEAYLMKKWNLGTHPDATAAWTTIPKLTYESGVKPELGSDTDLTVSELATDSAAVSKDGTGRITCANVPFTVTDCRVDAGALDVTYDFVKSEIAKAFRVDAGDATASHFVHTNDTWVKTWYDADGNGKFASNLSENCYPKHLISDGTDGLLPGRKYVDFGAYRDAADATSAGMRWNKSGSQGKNWDADVKEVHFVFALTSDCACMPFGNGENCGVAGQATPKFLTSGRQMFKTNDAQSGYKGCTNIWCLVDSDPTWRQNAWSDEATYARGSSFHVVSLVVRNGWTLRCSNFASSWGSSYRGGMKLAEAIVYDGTNATIVAEWIHAQLQQKWQGIGTGLPPAMQPFGTLHAAAGASLSATTPIAARVTALTGAGTFSFSNGVTLEGTQEQPFELSAAFTNATACTKLTVDGAVTLPAYGTVTLASETSARIRPGWYPVLSATSLSGDVANWSVVNPDGKIRRDPMIERRGNELGVRLIPYGVFLLVH